MGRYLEVLVLVQWSATLNRTKSYWDSLNIGDTDGIVVPILFLFCSFWFGSFCIWRFHEASIFCMAWATEDSSCTAFCAIICRTPRWGAFPFRITSVLTRMIHQESYLRVSLNEYVLRQISNLTYVRRWMALYWPDINWSLISSIIIKPVGPCHGTCEPTAL